MTAQGNSNWIAKVRILLTQGFGVEDIAVKLNCDVADVRNEVSILRSEGHLLLIYGIGIPFYPRFRRGGN